MNDPTGPVARAAAEASVPDSDDASRSDRGALSDKKKKILDEADRRDDEASARDIVSEERAEAADREAFLDSGTAYPGHEERRAAVLDRTHSKSDREASADDRAQLTEDNDTDGEG